MLYIFAAAPTAETIEESNDDELMEVAWGEFNFFESDSDDEELEFVESLKFCAISYMLLSDYICRTTWEKKQK